MYTKEAIFRKNSPARSVDTAQMISNRFMKMQQTVQTVAKVGQANANQADEMRTQQPGARMEDTAGSRFKQEDTGEKLEPTKEARIREILEEFLA